jgi:hypothetical protein
MVKIRDKLQLIEYLDSELAWRKKEIYAANANLRQVADFNSDWGSFLLKSSVVMLYAHWEGFIKNAATAYINFVVMQKLANEELSDSFVALSAHHTILRDADGQPTYQHITSFFKYQMKARLYIVWKEAINTNSNLNPKVLREILELLGLEYTSQYSLKEKLINDSLLRNRNSFAHGEQKYVEIDYAGFQEMSKAVIGDRDQKGLLEFFKDQIINAVELEKYKS